MIQKTLKYVGTLQDYGMPFCILYVDDSQQSLYIYLRNKGTKDFTKQYIVVKVHPEEVRNYMNGHLTLSQLFASHHSFYSTFRKGQAEIFSNTVNPSDIQAIIENRNHFDINLCEDSDWIEIYLNRLTSSLVV